MKNSAPIADHVLFFIIQIMPRFVAAFLVYKICKEVLKYEYYIYFVFSIIAILQYKFSFVRYTLYAINCEDEEKYGGHEILYQLSEISYREHSCIYKHGKSFVVKNILSERIVYSIAEDMVGTEILNRDYRTLLHPNMQSEHEEFYKTLLQIHNKRK
ncbi:MAG: hypothetical protein ACTFAK_12655 [Candidatus Electronema sp. VV]